MENTENMENMKNSDYLSEGYVVKVDIREIVNLPEWQELRGSLVGCWKKDPEAPFECIRGSIVELDNFLNIKKYICRSN